MNCEDARSRIDEAIDGHLPRAERAALETHLAECATCRRDWEGLRALTSDAGALARSIQPPRDLWPAIRSQIRRRKEASLARPRPWWSRAPALAAAAVGLAVLSSAVTAILLDRSSRETRMTGEPGSAPAVSTASLGGAGAWEAEVVRATDELAATVESLRGTLPPETMALLEENLRILDAAISESRAALERDPDSAILGEMLWATYEKKVELLRQAARLSAET